MTEFDKASRILTLLGISQSPSMEPGADSTRDKIAEIIGHEPCIALCDEWGNLVCPGMVNGAPERPKDCANIMNCGWQQMKTIPPTNLWFCSKHNCTHSIKAV